MSNKPYNPNGAHQEMKHIRTDQHYRFDPTVVGNFTFIEGKIMNANGIPLEEYSVKELIGIIQATSFFMLAAKRLPMDLTDNVRYVPFKDNRRAKDRIPRQ